MVAGAVLRAIRIVQYLGQTSKLQVMSRCFQNCTNKLKTHFLSFDNGFVV